LIPPIKQIDMIDVYLHCTFTILTDVGI
jgi:hypothetical protein